METYKLELTFTAPLLGTVSLCKDTYADFISAKAPDPVAPEVEAEVDTVEDAPEKGLTGFHRLGGGTPAVYDYVVKGFFKDACSMLRRIPDTLSACDRELRAFRKVIDGLVFIRPRLLPIIVGDMGITESDGTAMIAPGLERTDGGPRLPILVRPIRASTPQGERIAISRSELIPADSVLRCQVAVLGGVSEAQLREWLDYGALRGLGQWRNAAWGTFAYTLEKA